MGTYKEIKGNLITLAKQGKFDLIAHGCNCLNTMGAGIAPHMDRHFGCNDPKRYPLEGSRYKGDRKKLGKFQWNTSQVEDLSAAVGNFIPFKTILVANIYSQYHYHKAGPDGIPLEYDALEKALKDMGEALKSQITPLEIGLPRIGCGLAGGDWNRVSQMIKTHLSDHNVTIVNLE